MRKRTTIAQKQPDDIKTKVINYILYTDGLKANHAYPAASIAAADETAVWIDPIQNTTIEKTGAKSVPIFSSGYHKAKFTVLLAAKADGSKLKPFIILKGKRLPLALKDVKEARIMMMKNGWLSEEAAIDWIKNVWGSFAFGRRLLSWDAFNCHKTVTVKKELERIRTDVTMIPGGCTSVLQAPDVCWNKSFKQEYIRLYEMWTRNEGCTSENRTKAGNPRAPSKLLMCQWVILAWKSLPADLIQKFFKICALTTKTDGSEIRRQ